ncbi:MAG: hypothetical protein ACPKM1_15750 [Spirochaetaceae bacterium]
MALSERILKDLNLMANTSGRHAKEQILMRHRNSMTFRKILFHAYSPYLVYHLRKIPAKIVGKGSKDLSSDTWMLLYKLSRRTLTGIAARESLFEHIEELSPAAAIILKRIVRKDLQCGIATKTINKCLDNLIPTFGCQEVEDWEESRVSYPILIGPKIDGNRGEFRGAMYSKRGHAIVGLDHITDYINGIGKHMELSGELYIPGMEQRRSSGIVRSNKPKKSNVVFAVFDIPSLGSMPLDKRLDYLSRTFFPYGTRPQPPVVYIPHTMAETPEDVDKMYHHWVKMGFEGLVGKNPNGFFKEGKSYEWMRRVNLISGEYKIINVYEGEGRLRGMLGGVIIEGNIRVGSGFADDERKKYWANPDLILGKYATIIAKEKYKSGMLRQPIFKEIRWDIA